MKIYKISLNPFEIMPGTLQADTLQDSATHCTRCNVCAPHCPAYFFKPEESFSPRGRAQLIRLLLEQKWPRKSSKQLLLNTVQSCLLCAKCTAACAGKVPIAHQVIALAKAQKVMRLPASLRSLFRLRTKHPVCFDRIIKLGLALRRMGLLQVIQPILPHWFKKLNELLPARTQSLAKLLHKKSFPVSSNPRALYLPSLYATFVAGETGLAVMRALADQQPLALAYTASGLFEYVYGTKAACFRTARKLIVIWEKYAAGQPLPVWTDSIELFSFLKNYPLLFIKRPGWHQRAKRFAEQVHFITELDFSTQKIAPNSDKIALDASTALYPCQTQQQQALTILRTHFDKNLVECEYGACSVPVLGQSFWPKTYTQDMLKELSKAIAKQQVSRVYCLSGWAVLELDAALRRYYPTAHAKHLLHLMDRL